MISQTREPDLFESSGRVAAAYVKLVQYSQSVALERGEWEYEESAVVVASEVLERSVIETCDDLYKALPDSRVLKRRKILFHLEQRFSTFLVLRLPKSWRNSSGLPYFFPKFNLLSPNPALFFSFASPLSKSCIPGC